ncbi:type VII secretion system-associated protein [Amycolatopsis sp. cg5]|uniref:type VII secretion system-associated protein n=1 Tax=Amycolatopsis sp. cg5 TaxID=3238802 RepID=UPI003525A536
MTAMSPDNWFLLMDPAWRPAAENATPPIESVVGLWPVESDGKLGRFRPNPAYVPSSEDAPSDPLDAVLRLSQQGRAKTDHIQLMLRDTLFDIAMNGDGRPLITKSPDGNACVVVASGELHRARITAPEWLRIDLEDLVSLLADDVDVLINPGGPAAVRLTGDFMRETMLLDDEPVAAPAGGLRTATWSG